MSEALQPLSAGAVQVTIDGKLVLEHFAGRTDGPDSEPCASGTRFQIASISKQFTAAAVLTLVRERRLAVADKVANWFPHGPSGWDAVTVHQLLTHTSGLGQWEDFPEIDVFSRTEDEQFLQAISSHLLLSAPGSRFSYSSPGYWLLAQIIEKVTQQPYSGFIRQAVLEPAGLTDTFAGSPGQRPRVASGHSDDARVPSYELDCTGKGAGDIYSTAADLSQWNRALSGELLGGSCRAMMFTAHAAAGHSVGSWAKDDAYGYGWYLSSVNDGSMCYHSGHNSGFNSFSAWIPARALSVNILTNDDSIHPQPLARVLLTELDRA
jgi:CubicO group peptidase (beta-lactamase class C family)